MYKTKRELNNCFSEAIAQNINYDIHKISHTLLLFPQIFNFVGNANFAQIIVKSLYNV